MQISNLTEKRIGRTLVGLALPAIFSNLFNMVFEIADMFWVGKIGGEAVAALSTASFYVWMLRAVGLTTAIGALALVSMKIGANPGKIPQTTIRSARLSSLFFGFMFTLPALYFSRRIFIWMNLNVPVAEGAANYAAIFSLGLVFVFMMQNTEHIIRGMGNTRTPMIITGISLTLNIALDPLFMFVFGMGLKGAALATLISQAIGAILMEYALIHLSRRYRLCETNSERFHLNHIFRFARIGAPTAFSTAMFSLIYLLLADIIARFGDAPLAAIGIGHRIETIPYFISMGFAMALSTMVGQNLGAGRPDRVKESVFVCLKILSGLMITFSLLMFFFAETLYSFFISDSGIITHGIAYLKIIALFEVFLGFELVFEGAFSGAGDTQAPMWLIFGGTLFRLPVAYFFAVYWEMGTEAVWWAISLSTFIKGSGLAILFKKRLPGWRLLSDQKQQPKANTETLVVSQIVNRKVP